MSGPTNGTGRAAGPVEFNSRKGDASTSSISRNGINGAHSFSKKPFNKKWLGDSSKSTKLPVLDYKDTFMRLLDENQTIILVGETGSGKTTQIPQWCLEYCSTVNSNGGSRLKVACTQPRRVAAMSVATRVAKEMRVTLGQEVGYAVRFEQLCDSHKTKLKYLTDGMLLREAMFDPELNRYGVIVLDEAHERTIQTEILFGVLKRILATRSKPPLKVVIMSATINVKLFKKHFNSPILRIEGRQHAVQELFAEFPQSDLLTSTLICVFQIHRSCEEGDILVFCSGQDEIQSLVIMTKKVLKQAPITLQNLEPHSLYATMPINQQMKVFDQKPFAKTNGFSSTSNVEFLKEHKYMRKVIYATNVAETSITIPNIKYVIDTGKVKCRNYDPKTGFESLKVTTISKAQARQRSGRAGRVASGTCYRLYTHDDFTKMTDYLAPEIKRCNLDEVLLQMISMDIKEMSSFEFLEKPDDSRINAALTNLLNLRAIKPESTTSTTITSTSTKLPNHAHNDDLLNQRFDLTSLGLKLRMLPLNPSLGRILLAADELGCTEEAFTVISLLSIENLFHIPPNKQAQADAILQKFYSNEGDIVMFLKVFQAFKKTLQLNRSGLKLWCAEHFIHTKNLKTARMIRKQLCGLSQSLGIKMSSCGQDTSVLRRAMTYGLFNNVATMWDGKYRTKLAEDIHIHPSSCLFRTRPECVLYCEIVETNKRYMRNCTLIDLSWVREVSAANLKAATTASKQDKTK